VYVECRVEQNTRIKPASGTDNVFLTDTSSVPQQCFPAPPGRPQGVPRPDEICNPSRVFWVCPKASYQWDVPGTPPAGGAQEDPDQMPEHLNWPLSTQRSSGSTPSSHQMSELLTLSLRLSPATPQRKLISAACICDLILLVTAQSSWP